MRDVLGKLIRKLGDDDSDNDSIEIESDDEEEPDLFDLIKQGATVEVVQWALQKDKFTLLNTKDDYGRLPMYYAAALGRVDIMTVFRRNGCDIDPKDADERTPLFGACLNGETEAAQFLIDCGAEVNRRDIKLRTCLHEAVCRNHIDTALCLIYNGADVMAQEVTYGLTALHMCAEKKFPDMAEQLIIQGANLMSAGDEVFSKTPLHIACSMGHTAVARVLCERGADLGALCGFFDKTPLHCAVEMNHIETASLLIDYGADLTKTGVCGVYGGTPLHLAAETGKLEMARLLLKRGAPSDTYGKFTCKGTPLHVAAEFGQVEICKLFIEEFNVNVNIPDEHHNVPLHSACLTGQLETALYLIRMNADLKARNTSGHYPLKYMEDKVKKEELRMAGAAAEKERQRLAEIEAERLRQLELAEEKRKEEREERRRRKEMEQQRLLDIENKFRLAMQPVVDVNGDLSAITDVALKFPNENINIWVFPEEKCTALIRASFRGFEHIVVALLMWPNINVDAQDIKGNTALHYAAMRNWKPIVEHLLVCGAKTCIPNAEGKVAANVAKSEACQEIIRNPSLLSHMTRNWSQLNTEATAAMSKIFVGVSTYVEMSRNTTSVLVSQPHVHASTVVKKYKELTTTGFGIVDEDQYSDDSSDDDDDENDEATSQQLQVKGKKKKNLKIPQISGYDSKSNKIPSSPSFNSSLKPFSTVAQGIGHEGERWNQKIESSTRHGRGTFIEGEEGIDADTENFTRGYFGPVPAAFGGCREELFPNLTQDGVSPPMTKSQYKEWQLAEIKRQSSVLVGSNESNEATRRLLLSRLSMTSQAAHPPTSFDTTHQFCVIKDFLWLIGYPYKPSSPPSAVNDIVSHNTSTLPLKNFVPQDKRYCLYKIAKVMDLAHLYFSKCMVGKEQDLSSAVMTNKHRNDEGSHRHDDENIKGQEMDLLSIICTDFVKCVTDLFEPGVTGVGEHGETIGGWPKNDEGKDSQTLSQKITVMGRLNLFSEDAQQTLKKIMDLTTVERQPDLRVCPWRYRRVAIDGIYEISSLLMKRAEASFPVDSIRAHLWSHNGRKALDRIIQSRRGNQLLCEDPVTLGAMPPQSLGSSFNDGNSSLATVRELGGGNDGRGHREKSTTTKPRPAAVTPLSLFLMDMQLEEYAAQFAIAGFKTVDDFAGLTLEDCKEYFPFLKPGDLRRLSKQSFTISSEICESYENRASVGELKPPPLPLPPKLN